jgi:hypothetical protein
MQPYTDPLFCVVVLGIPDLTDTRLSSNNRGTLNYNTLVIEQNSVTVEWIGDNCSTLFEVQGFVRDDITSKNYTSPQYTITRQDTLTAEIPRSKLNTSAGDPIYYRLVGVLGNGSVCSPGTTIFYQFDGMYDNGLVATIIG